MPSLKPSYPNCRDGDRPIDGMRPGAISQQKAEACHLPVSRSTKSLLVTFALTTLG